MKPNFLETTKPPVFIIRTWQYHPKPRLVTRVHNATSARALVIWNLPIGLQRSRSQLEFEVNLRPKFRGNPAGLREITPVAGDGSDSASLRVRLVTRRACPRTGRCDLGRMRVPVTWKLPRPANFTLTRDDSRRGGPGASTRTRTPGRKTVTSWPRRPQAPRRRLEPPAGPALCQPPNRDLRTDERSVSLSSLTQLKVKF
jgi:hypothetical protein